MIVVHLCEANSARRAHVVKVLESAAAVKLAVECVEPDKLVKVLANSKVQVLLLGVDSRPEVTLQFVQRVMDAAALPILLLLPAAQDQADAAVFLDAGAVATLGLGYCSASETADRDALVRQVRILAGIRVIGRRFGSTTRAEAPVPDVLVPKPLALIAIGSSTGGPQALERLLGGLPRHFATPIAIVQHITAGFSANLLSWLNNTCALRVMAVHERVMPKPGCVYFAPEGEHLIVAKDGSLCPLPAPARHGHLPSVDVLFESVAEVHGARACGVLLTGMGRDGAEGLLAIRRRGGATAAQDEASCAVFGMPAAAIALQAAQRVADPGAIANWLMSLDPGARHV